jgi:hypothetical protein
MQKLSEWVWIAIVFILMSIAIQLAKQSAPPCPPAITNSGHDSPNVVNNTGVVEIDGKG